MHLSGREADEKRSEQRDADLRRCSAAGRGHGCRVRAAGRQSRDHQGAQGLHERSAASRGRNPAFAKEPATAKAQSTAPTSCSSSRVRSTRNSSTPISRPALARPISRARRNAKPELWQHLDAVKTAGPKLHEAELKLADVVKTGDAKTVGDTMTATYQESCNALCHDNYRLPLQRSNQPSSEGCERTAVPSHRRRRMPSLSRFSV